MDAAGSCIYAVIAALEAQTKINIFSINQDSGTPIAIEIGTADNILRSY